MTGDYGQHVSMSAREVYRVLLAVSDKEGRTELSNRELTACTGYSRRTIIYATRFLAQIGVVLVSTGGGRTVNNYQIDRGRRHLPRYWRPEGRERPESPAVLRLVRLDARGAIRGSKGKRS